MSLLVGRSGAKLAPELYGVTKIAQLCLVMRAAVTVAVRSARPSMRSSVPAAPRAGQARRPRGPGRRRRRAVPSSRRAVRPLRRSARSGAHLDCKATFGVSFG